MDKNLPDTLRRAADFLQNVTNKQHAGFIRFPLWYVEAMQEAADELEKLQAELAEERYRHDRYVDYAVERDRMMDQLKEDLRQSGRSDPCDYCKHKGEQLNCKGADFLCDLCLHGECRCHDCRDFSNWEWRGIG